ncbi:NAD(P)/FAD-dependent oxidoreductase [Dongia sp.]|uniref:NAD(P)/FAD-dependent oxidoreductase n=1 Tax=Dongia sp. TaxID=1977262 RepID=UPI003750B09A
MASPQESSFWWRDADPPETAPDLPERDDVVVIGAGLSGLSCALGLAERGISVTVIDSGKIGHGASSRSAGQVSGGVTTGKSLAGRKLPNSSPEQRRAMLREAAGAMTFLEETITRHAIDCDYQSTGRITAAWTPQHADEFGARIEELNTVTGAEASVLNKAETEAELGSRFYHGGLLIKRAAQLHPGKLALGLAEAARRHGARLAGGTPALRLERRPAGFRITTSRGPIDAGAVVLATNGYRDGLDPYLKRRIIPVASHVVVTEEIPERIAAEIIPQRRSISESRRVLNYFRFTPSGRRLLFGGRTRFYPISPARAAMLLRRAMVERFPQLKDVGIAHVWSGLVGLTFDAVPHIGAHDGLYHCVGCNGSGISLMTHLGHALSGKIAGDDRMPVSAFEASPFEGHRAYTGTPWFLPAVGSYLQVRDAIDRWRAPAP